MKLVRESISFKRGLDPKKALDVGNVARYRKDPFLMPPELFKILSSYLKVKYIFIDNKIKDETSIWSIEVWPDPSAYPVKAPEIQKILDKWLEENTNWKITHMTWQHLHLKFWLE